MASKTNIRKGHRAYVTKTLNDLAGELQGGYPDETQLLIYKTAISEKMERLKGLDDEILETLTEEADIMAEIDGSSQFRSKMQKGLFQIEKFIKDSGKQDHGDSSHSDHAKNVAKLPKLSIKAFTGNPLEFQSFWDTFSAAVDSQSSFDNVLKFTYLKSYLRGPALSAIEGLSLTSANYTEAVDILGKRFGNKQLLINSNVEKMMGIEPVESAQDIKKVRNVYDTIEVHVRNLTSLDIDTRHYGPVLISVIMAKIPEEIRLHISRSMSTNEQWDVNELMTTLKSEIDSRAMCQQMSTTSSLSQTNDHSFEEELEMTSTFHVGDRDPQQQHHQKGISCTYCKRNHPSSKCNVVTDVQARKNILRNKGRCFTCLKSGHKARTCKSKIKCYKCNGRHHISVCENQGPGRSGAGGGTNPPGGGFVPTGGGTVATGGGGFTMPAGGYAMPPGGYAMQAGAFLAPSGGSVAPTTVATAPIANGAVTSNGVPTPPPQFFQYVPLPEIQRVQTNVASSSKSNTLLQTAQCLISSTTTQERIRVLFDICAQKSFVNEDLCKKLNLSVVRWDPIILNGFQSENDVASWVKAVRARLCNINGVSYGDAELHVVPKICSAISQQTIEKAQSIYPHLNGLPLADCTNGDTNLEVQVLIGGNQYWNFVSGKLCRGPSGPVAMETMFGWVLSGNVEGHQQSCSTNLVTSTHVLQVGCELGNVSSVEFDRSMVDRIHDFWDTENLGLPSEEDQVMQEFNESIFFDGKNYHVPILFQCDPSVLPDNYSMCVSRLLSQFSKLQDDPNLLQIYDDIIRQQEIERAI